MTFLIIFFLGDYSLLSPMSNKPGDTETTPQKTSSNINTDQLYDEVIVNALKSQIEKIRKELQIEKEKTNIFETTQQRENESLESKTSYDKNNDKNDHNKIHNKLENARSQEQIDLFEKYMTCPGCHSHNKKLRDNVLIPCGHLVCGECVPHKGGCCPICMQNVNEHSQKLIV